MSEATRVPLRGLLDALPGLRQLATLAGVAGAVALALWLVLWSQGPDYTVLYGQLAARDAAAVVDALVAGGVPHRVDSATGGVLVPADRVHDARLKLASQGLPEGDGLGSELMRREDGFGTSQFMETARYQLALETELGRTIVRVQGVQAARVHLALPKPSVFVRDRQHASASVMLQLYPGRRLDAAQVAAIVHLVASSVPELEAGQVTVVDQSGTLLSTPRDSDGLAASARLLDYQRRIESDLEDRIEALLAPLVGDGRVRASVTADIDFSQAEKSSEQFDPAGQVVRSEQTSSDQRAAGDLAQGIPGALSNRPPQTTPAAVTEAQQGSASAAGPVAVQQRATRNYEIARTITHLRQPSGAIQRLSVAVLVDYRPATGEGAAPAPYPAEELEGMKSLVREAVGFDEARGDRIQLVNASFTLPPAVEAIDEPALWRDPGTLAVGRQALGALLVLVVAWFVLRPLMGSVVRPGAPVLLATDGPGPAGDRVTLGGRGAVDYDRQVATARSLVGQDPRRAADVVRDWVGSDGR
jgi:flagellar M-ring protein FliF